MQPDRAATSVHFGGRFVPEVLIAALDELEARDRALRSKIVASGASTTRAARLRRSSVAAVRAERFGERPRDAAVKREDTNHTGAHKINNTVGQALLARRMGKKRLIAETGAGTARRRDRDRRGEVRFSGRRLHGRRRRRAPSAQRVHHEAARRERSRCRKRYADAQGRDQRSVSRVGGASRTRST